jgi:hypothetical protein
VILMPDLRLHGPAERGNWEGFQVPFRIVTLTLRAITGKRKRLFSALRVTGIFVPLSQWSTRLCREASACAPEKLDEPAKSTVNLTDQAASLQ